MKVRAFLKDLRYARRYGVTVASLKPVVQALLAEGVAAEDVDAATVLARLVPANPSLANPELDIDKLLEIIERLLPLILAIIAAFG